MKNKKIIFTAATCLSLILNAPAFAKTVEEMNLAIKKIQDDWADAKYVAKTKDEKIAGLEKCAAAGAELSEAFPDRAEPIIWNGICLASQGELLKMSTLPKVKAAKALFEKAAKINDKALDGSAYTNLAVLYQRVPGWPIGFGDDQLAEENFQKALAIAPKNIDANYFYALFLMESKKFDEAQKHLNLALAAPSRNRPLADSKRKEEIEAAIIKLKNLQR